MHVLSYFYIESYWLIPFVFVHIFSDADTDMVKLTAELIQNSMQYINPVKDRELDLRGNVTI